MSDQSNESILSTFVRAVNDLPDDRYPKTQTVNKSGVRSAILPAAERARHSGMTAEMAGRRTIERQKQEEVGQLVTRRTHPWDRLGTETGAAYEAFCIYRDLGVERSMAEVCRVLEHSGDQTVRRWAATNDWAARARSYDEWEEKRVRRANERVRLEARQRQARLGQLMQEKAETALVNEVVQVETVSDVVNLAKAGTQIERLALGESTENIAAGIKLVLPRLPEWAKGMAIEAGETDEAEDTAR